MIRDIFGYGHCPLVLLSRDRKKQAFGKYDFSIEFTSVLIFSRAIEMEN